VEIDMELSRRALRAAAAAAALAAFGCSSASDRFLAVESYPPGASVRLGVDGRAVGQTPLDKLHVQVPKGSSAVLILERDGYQTVAYPVTEESPSKLFFGLQKAPDNDAVLAALKELQNSISVISASLATLRADLEKRGGN
jgi:PEGA domain